MSKKLTLTYITNDEERKACFNKRKKDFLKKLNELCTLCDVEACCILYNAYETEPIVWPNPETVHTILERFNTISSLKIIKNTVDQKSDNSMRTMEIHDEWYKMYKENQRKELELYMFEVISGKYNLDSFDVRNVADMRWVINKYLKDLDAQINKLRGQNSEGSSNVIGIYSRNKSFDGCYNDGGDDKDDKGN